MQLDGHVYALQEILERDALLILRVVDRPRPLQADQHGDPRRHGPEWREIPLVDPISGEVSAIAQRFLDAAGD
ncbi:hypothetical protein KHP57_12340 [Algiphilus sp. NNCM1]|nr:hypothetical protein [Algiphilus acroporae]MCI5062086.1 hypothetical protein [Algiphilus sp.]